MLYNAGIYIQKETGGKEVSREKRVCYVAESSSSRGGHSLSTLTFFVDVGQRQMLPQEGRIRKS